MLQDDWMRWLLSLIGAGIGVWTGLSPVFQTLIGLMMLDYLTGMAAAMATHDLSSKTGLLGLVKKGAIVFVVTAIATAQYGMLPYIGETPLPAAELVAGAFGVNELISILENVDRLGVRLPDMLRRLLRRND